MDLASIATEEAIEPDMKNGSVEKIQFSGAQSSSRALRCFVIWTVDGTIGKTSKMIFPVTSLKCSGPDNTKT